MVGTLIVMRNPECTEQPFPVQPRIQESLGDPIEQTKQVET